MAKVLIVGCGDLGAKIAENILANGHEVLGVRRSAKQIEAFKCIQANVTNASSLNELVKEKPTILIYCVSADAQTDESYRMHYVEGFRNVLETQLSNQKLQHVFFISSTRVFGQQVSELLNESTLPLPNDFGGKRLLEAEHLMDALRCGTTVIRLSGIYGNNRLYLLRMVKDPSRWPSQDRWTNRIHRDDAANFLAYLCERVLSGKTIKKCYIGTDGNAVKLSEVLAWLAAEIGVAAPSFPDNQPVAGKRLDNEGLRESGFVLQYPSYRAGYEVVLNHV